MTRITKEMMMRLRQSLWLGALVLLLSPLAATASCEEGKASVQCGNAPSATIDDKGRLWVAFVQDEHVYVANSADQGRSYSVPVRVNLEPEDAEYNGENRPKILVDGESVYVSWTKKTSPRFTGEIRFSRSTDGGRTFSEPRTINDDGLLTGHRFESLFLTDSGHLYLTWIDKRDLEAHLESGRDYNGAAVYYAVSDDGGASFSRNYRVSDHSCECCRIAVAPRGADSVAILWRQIFGVNTRDHAITVLSPDGEVAPVRRATYDEWQIDACPHHGPTMVRARGIEAYHMSWFSNGDAHQGVYYGRFDLASGEPRGVMPVDANPGAGHPFLATLGSEVHLIWKGFDGRRSLIRHIRSGDNGATWSQPQTLATTEQGSDHPLIVSGQGSLFLSWKTDEHGYVFEPFAGDALTNANSD